MHRIFLLTCAFGVKSIVQIFVGSEANNVKLQARPDPFFTHTLISSFDFTCSPEYKCEVVSNFKKITFYGRVLSYVEIRVPIDFFEENLKEKTKVFYFHDEPNGLGSVVGLRKDSPFLEGLFANHRADSLNFWIDSSEEIYFGSFQSEDKTSEVTFVKLDYSSEVTLQFDDSSNFENRNLKLCMQTPPDTEEEPVWFYVQNRLFNSLTKKISSRAESTSDSQYERGIAILLVPNDNSKALSISYDSIVDGDDLGFKSQKLEIAECDLYPGKLFLENFNFRFVYSSTSESFKTFFGLEASQQLIFPKEKKTFWWKFLLVVVLVVGGAYAYQYYRQNILNDDTIDEKANDSDDVQQIELKEYVKNSSRASQGGKSQHDLSQETNLNKNIENRTSGKTETLLEKL